MPNIGAPELIIVGIILVLLFGATRLPATAKGLGQALRLFKKEVREDDEDKKPEVTAAPQQQVQPPQQAPVYPAQAPVQQQNGQSEPVQDQSAVKPGNQV